MVPGKISQESPPLGPALLDGGPAHAQRPIAQLEVRRLEGQIARGEDTKMAVHASMASRGYCHGPEGDRDAIGDLGLHRRSWAMDDPDFVDRLVMLHPRRPDDRAPPSRFRR